MDVLAVLGVIIGLVGIVFTIFFGVKGVKKIIKRFQRQSGGRKSVGIQFDRDKTSTDMSDQSQMAGKASLAIQSGGNMTIGISEETVKTILDIQAQQIKTFGRLATEIINDRGNRFHDRVIDEFFAKGTGNKEAFKDPDFQCVVGSAQTAYARSGDDDLATVLIDIIADRSKVTERSRLQIALNSAIDIAPKLTVEEYSALSLMFLFGYTIDSQIDSHESLASFLKAHVTPLLPHISKHIASYGLIAAMHCGTTSPFTKSLTSILINNYGGIFCKGFSRSDLENALPRAKHNILDIHDIVGPCLNDATKLQIKAINRIKAMEVMKDIELDEAQKRNIVDNLFQAAFMDDRGIRSVIRPYYPDIDLLFDVWTKSPVSSLELTVTGIVIAHANLSRTTKFSAPLKIWIE
ncbi:MAG: hypothetical protein HY057_02275 [Rhodospirillales bacterium]|nr:hypothetical protein [Rhodospirillales bacterium]